MRVALRNPMVGKLGEDFDRVFDRMLVPRFLTEPLLPPFPFEGTGAEWIPALDLNENATENLDVNLTGELLTITGKREFTPEIEGEGYLVKERAYGKFARTIRVPTPVAEKKVLAEYRDGVLLVHLPKETPVPATKIVIK